jgi:hypothetical protein
MGRTNFESFKLWAWRAMLAGLLGSALGATLCGVWFVFEQVSTREERTAELVELARKQADASEHALNVRQIAAATPETDGINFERLQQLEKAEALENEARNLEDRADRIRRGPEWFLMMAASGVSGAAILMALPAAVAAWFLLLHMIGQLSTAARGGDPNSTLAQTALRNLLEMDAVGVAAWERLAAAIDNTTDRDATCYAITSGRRSELPEDIRNMWTYLDDLAPRINESAQHYELVARRPAPKLKGREVGDRVSLAITVNAARYERDRPAS